MSNEHAIAQYERETDPPPVKRPWAVMSHYLRHTGVWSRWRVLGTYTSRERAEAGAAREKTRWEKGGTPVETRIVEPGAKRI